MLIENFFQGFWNGGFLHDIIEIRILKDITTLSLPGQMGYYYWGSALQRQCGSACPASGENHMELSWAGGTELLVLKPAHGSWGPRLFSLRLSCWAGGAAAQAREAGRGCLSCPPPSGACHLRCRSAGDPVSQESRAALGAVPPLPHDF